MFLPFQCFGKDSVSTAIFPPEEYCVRCNKFVFPQNLYSVLIKQPNLSLYGKYPDLFLIRIGTNSLKLHRRYNVTDEYEGYEVFTEFQFPINNELLLSLKLPYGFKFNYLSQDTSIQLSNNSFYYSKIDQPRENYKYYLHFSVGEKVNFISQVQYSTKYLLSVFYNVDQISLIHSMHPFSPQLLISSCFKKRKLGSTDFFQRIHYQSKTHNFAIGFFDTIKDIKRRNLNKGNIGLHIIKKFNYFKFGIELQSCKQEFPRLFPALYTKFYFNQISPTLMIDQKKINISLKFRFSNNSYFAFSSSKHIDEKKIGFFVKYIDEN